MRCFLLISLLVWSFLATGGTSLHALVISGSDLFGETVRSNIKDGLKGKGIEADITFDGSLLGLRDLEAGLVDATLLAVPDGRWGESNLRRFPVGFQIVAIAVHASNPVTELSYADLENLFKDNGTLDDWNDLTSDPAWSDRKVSLLASRRENAITLELFNALVLKGDRLKPSVRYSAGSTEELATAVVEDTTALALVPAMTPSGPLKLLAIKESADYQAYTPSLDNVFFGDYPLRLPFYLVVSDDLDAETLGKLLSVIYSASVTDALWSVNCLPVPEPEQQSILRQFQ
jgi:phosphate transport system substrate-binding protein